MPAIDTHNTHLKALSGIHIWHADMSSCSQRVRIALAEKSLEYTSHLINLHAGENASEAYQAIHPEGLVPAMVIDGTLFIESIDIIDEINRQGGELSLRPNAPLLVKDMEALMFRASKAQPALKLLTFEFLFSAAPPPSAETFEAFQKNHKNEYLTAFFRDYAKGFERERVSKAVRVSHDDFTVLESFFLDGRNFLAGDCFSLADIAWIPNFHRFALFGWPFENYPKLNEWFGRVRRRPSYKKGLLDWEPKELIDHVVPTIKARVEDGDGVSAYVRKIL